MDTRDKIRTPEQAHALLQTGDWAVVATRMDALTLETVSWLERVAGSNQLLVVIRSAPDAVLALEARAALAASLRMVTAVVIDTNDGWHFPPCVRLMEDPEGDEQRLRLFRARIAARGAA